MVLRVAKPDSAYLYALLEAYEGVVNYSTLPTEKACGYRDIYVFSTPSLFDELQKVITLLRQSVSFQILDNHLFLSE